MIHKGPGAAVVGSWQGHHCSVSWCGLGPQVGGWRCLFLHGGWPALSTSYRSAMEPGACWAIQLWLLVWSCCSGRQLGFFTICVPTAAELSHVIVMASYSRWCYFYVIEETKARRGHAALGRVEMDGTADSMPMGLRTMELTWCLELWKKS